MAHLITNTFSSYAMTSEELSESSILTLDQVQNIQTQIATLAEAKLALEPDPVVSNIYLQKEAHLRGQIDALKYLLTLSAEAVAAKNNHNPEI